MSTGGGHGICWILADSAPVAAHPRTGAERQNAEENAYQGGAKDVKNELTVTYEYYGPYPEYGPYYWRGFYPPL